MGIDNVHDEEPSHPLSTLQLYSFSSNRDQFHGNQNGGGRFHARGREQLLKGCVKMRSKNPPHIVP